MWKPVCAKTLRTCLENVVEQASRLPLGRLGPVFSRARRPFIAGRRPAPLFFRHAQSFVPPGPAAFGTEDLRVNNPGEDFQ